MTPLQKAQARLGAMRRGILQKEARRRRVRAANAKAVRDVEDRKFRAAVLEKMMGVHEAWGRTRRLYYAGK